MIPMELLSQLNSISKTWCTKYLLGIIFLFVWTSQQAHSFTYHRLRPGCEFMTNEDWSKNQALLLNKQMTEIIHPEIKDSVFLAPTEEIVLACPGSQIVLKNQTLLDATILPARCNCGTSIKVGDDEYNFNSAECEKTPKTEAKIVGICFNKTNILKVEIGFNVENNFIKLITVCLDDNTLGTVYSNYKASSKIIGRQHSVERPRFFDDARFYHGIKIWKLYSKNVQRNTIAEILGSTELAAKYIKNDTAHYLARGHLTAKADFIYGAEQIGTFYYINVAPQWQIINSGNWAALEDNIRTYVIKNDIEISVYTIPYEVALLPDVNNNLQELYLDYESYDEKEYYTDYETENYKHLVPVPKFYIKIIVHEEERKGTAFVTINNPYLDEITDDYILCDDVCDKFPWLTWDAKNIEKGYSYCCPYTTLKNTIDYLPDLPILELLD